MISHGLKPMAFPSWVSPTSTLPAGGVAVPVVRHGVLIANPSSALWKISDTSKLYHGNMQGEWYVMGIIMIYVIMIYVIYVIPTIMICDGRMTGWCFFAKTPLKNIRLRPLGWWQTFPRFSWEHMPSKWQPVTTKQNLSSFLDTQWDHRSSDGSFLRERTST